MKKFPSDLIDCIELWTIVEYVHILYTIYEDTDEGAWYHEKIEVDEILGIERSPN